MTAFTLTPSQTAALDALYPGRVFTPERPGYAEAKKLFNGMIKRTPAGVVQCLSPEEVSAVIRFARAEGIELSIRSGGHGVSGQALGDGVITIDLSKMKGMAIDPVARTARVGAGITWGELDPASQAFGLAVTGGRVPSTGVAGLTLGSGSGWLERTLGFTCDNLIEAQVVLANGSIVRASEDEHPDLLWGLKGGGGNFGVVTEFVFRLHPIGPQIVAGSIFHPFEDAAPLLKAYNAFMQTASDLVGGSFAFVTLPNAPHIPDAARGKLVATINAIYFGPVEEGEAVLAPLRALGTPILDTVMRKTYCDLQNPNRGEDGWGINNYYKADFIRVLDDAAIAAFVDEASRITSPDTALLLQPLGGVPSRVPVESTPLGRRDAAYAYHCLTAWREDEHDRHVAWTRGLSAAMQPFAVAGVYLTYMGEDHEQRVREAYGPEKFERLVAIKDRYDPQNIFHRNPNIRPSRQHAQAVA